MFNKGGQPNALFFKYRDETDIAFKEGTLIKSEDDVIKAVTTYLNPDNNSLVIKETFLDIDWFREEQVTIIKQLIKYLNEGTDIP